MDFCLKAFIFAFTPIDTGTDSFAAFAFMFAFAFAFPLTLMGSTTVYLNYFPFFYSIRIFMLHTVCEESCIALSD